MDLSTITVADFKALFFRDFPFLPTYDASKIYNLDAVTYYSTTDLFYKALQNGVVGVTPGTDANKWVIYPTSYYNYVLDGDITKAFSEAKVNFNQGLFSDDDEIKLGYLYLTAHYLVNDLKAAKGGVNASAFMLATGRTVGSVSEQYSIPQFLVDSPMFAFYAQSAYGMKYMSLIGPSLIGNVGVVFGATLP
jgi:hypothetical protein